MKSILKNFGGSIAITALCFGLAAWWGIRGPLGPWTAIWLVTVLSVLEVSLSFDNAVVNAKVLKDMTAFWRTMFLTAGVIVAVFGMRLVFPIVIVAVSADISMANTISMALNSPEQYGATLNQSYPVISAFGGAFLLLVFLNFMFDHEKETHWLGPLEEPLTKIARFQEISVFIALMVIFSCLWWVEEKNQMRVFVAGVAGIILYLAVDAVGALFDGEGESVAVVGAVKRAGFASFLYLEVLDASFSFDGVIGAFAITKDVVIIMLGLAVGAMFVRSMTIYLVNKGTLSEYVFLDHGAHYAIGALSIIMISGLHLPEFVTGLVGVGFIVASLVSSNRHRAAAALA